MNILRIASRSAASLLLAGTWLSAGASAATSPAAAREALPTYCPDTSESSHPRELWSETNYDSRHDTALMELQWFPEPGSEQDLGRIVCSYAPWISRMPLPRLTSRFLVRKPVTPGWMYPAPQYDWLLCSGATMTEFEPRKCPFVPVDEEAPSAPRGSAPDDGPDAGVSPF